MDENAAQPPIYESPPPATPPPPPLANPPRWSPPPPPPANQPGRGRGWMIFALILLALLIISVISNLGHYATNAVASKGKHIHSVGPKLEEVITEDNDGDNKIAVVEISGIISSRTIDQSSFNMVEVIRAQLKRAEEDDKVKAVILKVDSPGGEVLASDEIYHEIADFQKNTRKPKPVIASMGNLAASGGYYVSAPCRWIVANDLTITGSIGVIMHGWNYRGLMNKVGVKPETYKSGKFKDMLSGDRNPEEIPPEERAMVQGLIDETYGKFKKVVEDGRKQAFEKNKNAKEKGQALSDDWKDYADGRVLSGTAALKLGFVDQLGNFQDAVDRAKTIVNVTTPVNLIEYHQHYDFTDLFRLFGKSESRAIKVDLGMDLPKLQVGQLYFLAPMFAH